MSKKHEHFIKAFIGTGAVIIFFGAVGSSACDDVRNGIAQAFNAAGTWMHDSMQHVTKDIANGLAHLFREIANFASSNPELFGGLVIGVAVVTAVLVIACVIGGLYAHFQAKASNSDIFENLLLDSNNSEHHGYGTPRLDT